METLIKQKKTNKTDKANKANKANNTGSLKFSVRIRGEQQSLVSSISLKKNLCSLWLLLCTDIPKEPEPYTTDIPNTKVLILNFIHLSLDTWDKDTAKGFSDFITDRMIKNILDKTSFNYIDYQHIKYRI